MKKFSDSNTTHPTPTVSIHFFQITSHGHSISVFLELMKCTHKSSMFIVSFNRYQTFEFKRVHNSDTCHWASSVYGFSAHNWALIGHLTHPSLQKHECCVYFISCRAEGCQMWLPSSYGELIDCALTKADWWYKYWFNYLSIERVKGKENLSGYNFTSHPSSIYFLLSIYKTIY